MRFIYSFILSLLLILGELHSLTILGIKSIRNGALHSVIQLQHGYSVQLPSNVYQGLCIFV